MLGRLCGVQAVMYAVVFVTIAMLLPRFSQAETRIDLNGAGWSFRTLLDEHSVPVEVPHCWQLTEGYARYLGTAYYERDFDVSLPQKGQVARLQFEAVYSKTRVWLNGIDVGGHEGGYSPFELVVTHALRAGHNHLVVQVDNMPSIDTIPGVATAGFAGKQESNGSLAPMTIFGWMPYGGIVRPVYLVYSQGLYPKRVKVEVQPDPDGHTARLRMVAWLRNDGDEPAEAVPHGVIAGLAFRLRRMTVKPHSEVDIHWVGMLQGAHLWSVRDPFLYTAYMEAGGEKLTVHFGVRTIRVRGTELLLNGRVVHLFGANRVSEDPREGPLESKAIVERDLGDMLAANMRMMRIAHYPESQELLDYADQHGMLIIAEAGNWNMSAWQMADPEIRRQWKRQMQEMVQDDWNHPSVIAWSMGNEYESATGEGMRWTRDMRRYTLTMDSTRLITFASRFATASAVTTGDGEASRYCDFVSVNLYGDYAAQLDRVHKLWPGKPVFVTEFGHMGEPGLHDPKRIENLTEAVTAMKERSWVIGGAVWTWADYRSLFRGTPADGIRRWGVVDFERRHRDSWKVVQGLFATELP